MLLSGSIGGVLLEKKINNIKKKVLVLADVHDGVSYCKNESSKISDFLDKNKYTKNILLEEVPRDKVNLKELWPGSPHTHSQPTSFCTDRTAHCWLGLQVFLRAIAADFCPVTLPPASARTR